MATDVVPIHVKLLNEGVEVSRPTTASSLGGGLYKVLPTEDYNPTDELWEFTPGSVVRLRKVRNSAGEHLLAVMP